MSAAKGINDLLHSPVSGVSFFLGMKSPNVHPSSSPTPEPGDFSLQVFRGRSWGIMETGKVGVHWSGALTR